MEDYNTKEALLTTRCVELVDQKEFAAAALDPEHETYVVHVGPQVSGLIAEEAPTKVSAEYSDFADMFSLDLASKLPQHTGINDHLINLVDNSHLTTFQVTRRRSNIVCLQGW